MDEAAPSPVFVVKNGLSVLLMVAIWRANYPDRPFNYHFDDDPRHIRDVTTLLGYVTDKRRLTSGSQISANSTLYVTTSASKAAREFLLEGPACARVVVEHGTAESWRFATRSRKLHQNDGVSYAFLFYEKVVEYLERHALKPFAPLRPIPLAELRAFVREHGEPVENSIAPGLSTVFLMQPMLERKIISEDGLRQAIEGFLDRRPAMHYIIKDHPEPSPQTIALLVAQLEKRKLTCEVLSDDRRMIELSFSSFRCDEVSTFYSTGAMACGVLFDTPYDTMLPEISGLIDHVTVRQKGLVRFLNAFLRPP